MSYLDAFFRLLVDVRRAGVSIAVRRAINLSAAFTASDNPTTGAVDIGVDTSAIGDVEPTPDTLVLRGNGGEGKVAWLEAGSPTHDSGALRVDAGAGLTADSEGTPGTTVGLIAAGENDNVNVGGGASTRIRLRLGSSPRLDIEDAVLTAARPIALPTTAPAAIGQLSRNTDGRLVAHVDSAPAVVPVEADVPILYQWFKEQDAGTSTTTAQMIGLTHGNGVVVTAIVFFPVDGLTAHDSNYATLIVQDSEGTLVASVTTQTVGSGGSGDWSAEVAIAIPFDPMTAALLGYRSLTFGILKAGGGVVVPAGIVSVECYPVIPPSV